MIVVRNAHSLWAAELQNCQSDSNGAASSRRPLGALFLWGLEGGQVCECWCAHVYSADFAHNGVHCSSFGHLWTRDGCRTAKEMSCSFELSCRFRMLCSLLGSLSRSDKKGWQPVCLIGVGWGPFGRQWLPVQHRDRVASFLGST